MPLVYQTEAGVVGTAMYSASALIITVHLLHFGLNRRSRAVEAVLWDRRCHAISCKVTAEQFSSPGEPEGRMETEVIPLATFDGCGQSLLPRLKELKAQANKLL